MVKLVFKPLLGRGVLLTVAKGLHCGVMIFKESQAGVEEKWVGDQPIESFEDELQHCTDLNIVVVGGQEVDEEGFHGWHGDDKLVKPIRFTL
jgi:hypothetical protein